MRHDQQRLRLKKVIWIFLAMTIFASVVVGVRLFERMYAPTKNRVAQDKPNQVQSNQDKPNQDKSNQVAGASILSSVAQLPNAEFPVYICGAVKHPSVQLARDQMYLAQLIEACGGLAQDADATGINLAMLVKPQMMVYIPKKGEQARIEVAMSHGLENGDLSDDARFEFDSKEVHPYNGTKKSVKTKGKQTDRNFIKRSIKQSKQSKSGSPAHKKASRSQSNNSRSKKKDSQPQNQTSSHDEQQSDHSWNQTIQSGGPQLTQFVQVLNGSNRDLMSHQQTVDGEDHHVYQIDLNTADMETLCELPGIGASLAQNIIDYRTSVHGYRHIEELKKVPGIKSSKFNLLKPYIYVAAMP